MAGRKVLNLLLVLVMLGSGVVPVMAADKKSLKQKVN